MYCENCQLEIKEQDEKQCPLCGGPLSESSAAANMPDKSAGIDFESLMQDDASAFVLDDDDESGGLEPAGQAAPETYSPETNVQEQRPAADAALSSGAMAFSDDSSADMLDQVLQEYDPLVDEHFKVKKPGSKLTTTMLLIVLLVCALGGGAYYYFMMREQEAPAPVAPVQIARPQKKDAVLDKVLRKEPLPAQQAAADNATRAAKKPDDAKPAQAAGEKMGAPIVAEPLPAAVQPVEPTVPAKMPEKAARQDRRQPEAAMEKTEPAPSEPPAAVAPAQRPAPSVKPAEEEVKKSTEPATAPVAKPPVAAADKPVFSVLTGSFRSQSNAEAEVNRVNKLGFDARTVTVDLKGKGQWHRVLIGSWPRRADALKAVNDVRRKTGKKDASVIAVE